MLRMLRHTEPAQHDVPKTPLRACAPACAPVCAVQSPDCWSANLGSLDVHYSSGPANHWFYLLAEGSGVNAAYTDAAGSPTCNGGTVAGIGRDKAAAIVYYALTSVMTSTTNYAQARAATLNAAATLYGVGGAEWSAVAAAWSAVNVN